MKTFFTVLFVIIWVIGMIVVESYYQCASLLMCVIGILILFILNLFYDSIEEHDEYPLLMIFFMTSSFVIPIISLCFGGLRIIREEDSSVRVVSGLYPLCRTLAVGERIDTLHQVPCCYERLDKGMEVVHRDLFLLNKNDTMSILFDRSHFIFEGRNIRFSDIDYGYGQIRIFSYKTQEGQQRIVDSYGRDVNDSNFHVIIQNPLPDLGY